MKKILKKILKKIWSYLNIHFLDYKDLIDNLYANSKAEFIYETRFGFKTIVHKEKLFDILITNQVNDAEDLMVSLDEIITYVDLAIDVGANIGIVSSWLSKKSKLVYSFEPDQENIRIFQKNNELNNIDNIVIKPCAVSSTDEKISFYRRSSYGHHSILKKHTSNLVNELKVSSITLDKFCTQNSIENIPLLKIDVEGAELDVLHGCKKLLSEKKINLIIFEHAPVFLNDSNNLDVFNLLSENSFEVFDMSHNLITREIMSKAKQADYYAKLKK